VRIKGASTGRAPIQVNKSILTIKPQNRNWLIKKFLFLAIEKLSVNGRTARIAIDKIKQITPPNLFGIDRRIA
jgi:hypothetical protein